MDDQTKIRLFKDSIHDNKATVYIPGASQLWPPQGKYTLSLPTGPSPSKMQIRI